MKLQKNPNIGPIVYRSKHIKLEITNIPGCKMLINIRIQCFFIGHQPGVYARTVEKINRK